MKSFIKLSRYIGIDLGSSQINIWSDKDGFVINEPAYIAIDQESHKVIAVGSEALQMKGRVGGDVEVFQPIINGRIYDIDLLTAMMKVFLLRVLKTSYFFSPVIMVSVPATSTPVDRKAVTNLFYSLGAKEVLLISQPLAAAIGAGLPIADSSGSFIFQMGAGLVEAAVISLGSMVTYQGSSKAGNYADQLVTIALNQEYELVTSQTKSENVKIELGSMSQDVERELLVSGQDLQLNSPKEILISSDVIFQSLYPLAEHYTDLIKELMSKIPPALTVDIIDKGLLLSGGWAQLQGWSEYFTEILGIPVSVVNEAEDTAIKGIATALEHIDEFEQSLGYKI